MSEKGEYFVGIPGFVVDGDPMEEGVLDGIVETLEVNASDVEVVEREGKFYVFLKNQMTYETVCEKIAEDKQLNEAYKLCVSAVTRSVRRVDKYQDEYNALRREIEALKEETETLSRTLSQEEQEREEQNRLARAVEADFQSLIGSIQHE